MKKIYLLICNFFIIFSLAFSLQSEYKVIYSDKGLGKLDINIAKQEDMLKAGVAPSYVSKIISFRDKKGGIESLDELDRINGIGKKTCKKLEKDMLKAGVAPSYVSKIISFRDKKGGIESLDELDRINGIGKKTCKKLEKYFFVGDNYKINPLKINKADETLLKYYGFSKEEIKAIQKLKKENKYIRNNIELRKILSKKSYNKYKDLFRYDRY